MVLASQALAYNGEFCYGYYLSKSNNYSCQSSTETHVRRAIGHSGGAGDIGLYPPGGGPAYVDGYCYSDGCTADTGYYSSDVTAFAVYRELPGASVASDMYGWMYP